MVIKCRDCGTEFSVDEKEQKWFESKGLQMPKRCKACRDKRKQSSGKKPERK